MFEIIKLIIHLSTALFLPLFYTYSLFIRLLGFSTFLKSRAADPVGVYPDPDPTLENKPDPDPTLGKQAGSYLILT